MPITKININNSQYKVICRDGQEDRLSTLVKQLNSRIEQLKTHSKGKCSELTLLVLVALDLEDQLNEKESECTNITKHIRARLDKLKLLLNDNSVL